MYSDWITIQGIRAQACHGVFAFEKQEAQEFRVDISYQVFTAAAIAKDDIAESISYADIAAQVQDILHGESINLIETLAHRIAMRVIESGARQVKVRVHKPQAPVPIDFTDIFVEAERQAEILSALPRNYVIGVGANLGNVKATLESAITQLREIMELEKVSSFYRTAPILAPEQAPQAPYINAVLEAKSSLPPLEILHKLQEIENQHGRERLEKWGSRTLDLDLIAVDNLVSADPELLLPHPRAHRRRFVLEPWAEISPEATLSGIPIRELLTQVGEQQVSRCSADYTAGEGESL